METPQPSPQNPTLEFIWGQYRIWAATASRLKKELTLWRVGAFVLTITGAFAAVISQNVASLGFPHISKGLEWISAAAVGIAGYAASKMLTSENEKKWIQARSAAQRCKADAYLYLLQVNPYHDNNGDTVLFSRVESLVRSLYTIPQVSLQTKDELKDIPASSYTFHDYLEERIRRQAKDFYFPKAERYRKFVRRGHYWGIALGVAGFLAGSLGALGESEHTSIWVAFISTVAASVTSFISASRYQYLSMSYQVIANQLMILWAKGRRITAEETERQKEFVKQCEEILSLENEAWVAELSKEDSGSPVSSTAEEGISGNGAAQVVPGE